MTSHSNWEIDAWDYAYSGKPMKLKKTDKRKPKIQYRMFAEDILLLRQLSLYFAENNSEQMSKLLSEMANKYTTAAADAWCLGYEHLKTKKDADTNGNGE